MKTRTALITGVTGQDGHYLSKTLQDMGYQVYGLFRRTSQPPKIPPGVIEIEGDMTDASSLAHAVSRSRPDEIYHLAAQSHVHSSFSTPVSTFEINAAGTLNLLEAVRTITPRARLYNAATSELFGMSMPPQDEGTRMQPRSPYAVAKLAAYEMTKLYRDAYGLFACNGILFNHESPLRGENFVTQKIAMAVARIKAGLQNRVVLGNLSAQRDWGHAEDYVRGMWLMLQQSDPDDYVLATGETHTVGEFARQAFGHVGLKADDYIETDEKFKRPAEVPALQGSPRKAEAKLGWTRDYTFNDLVAEMVEAAIRRVRDEK